MRRRGKEMMSQIGVGIGPDVTTNRMQRIGGWGGPLKSWWQRVDIMVHKRRS